MELLRQTMSQTQTLRQEQIMAPQQIQSLEILLATIPQLEQRISQELVENPTLELEQNGTEDLVGNPLDSTGGDGDGDSAGKAAEKDESLAQLIQLDESWHDYASPPHTGSRRYTEEDEERRQFLLDSLVDEPSLQDVLLEQLREANVTDERQQRICEEIVGSIDDTGYVRTHLADIAIACGAELEEVERALAVIQTFDPPGIGARDLRECLLLQLEHNGRRHSLAYELVSKHLEDLGRNQIPKVARALRISPTRLYEILAEIRKLYPFPGSQIAPANTDYVVPEVYVERDEAGEWQVRTNSDSVPRLRISQYYLQLLQSPETSAEVKSYVRHKITDSRMLLNALAQRESTIERITRCLLRFQRGFFEGGLDRMAPLTMNEVAAELGVHETTISRAVAGKYVQTPFGVMPLRRFFSAGMAKQDGQMVSSLSIKQRLQELLSNEDPREPFSDQKLGELLQADGFRVARRTVAKYREEIGVLPSHLRRSF